MLNSLEDLIVSAAWNAVRRAMQARRIPSPWECQEREMQIEIFEQLTRAGYAASVETNSRSTALGRCDLTIHDPSVSSNYDVRIPIEVKKYTHDQATSIQLDFLRLDDWRTNTPGVMTALLVVFVNGASETVIQHRMMAVDKVKPSNWSRIGFYPISTAVDTAGAFGHVRDVNYTIALWRPTDAPLDDTQLNSLRITKLKV